MFIAPATPEDAPAIATLVNAAYRGTSAARGWTHEADLLGGQRTDHETLQAAMRTATVLVMRDAPGRPLAGCVSLERKDDGEGLGDGDTWYLGMLTIDPARQADGLGRHLLEAGEAFARDRGARRLELTVIQVRASLIAWYERRGYRRTGATAPFPYGDARFGEPLRDDLHFVVLDKALEPR